MKRIVICLALAVVSLAISIGSFLTNDVSAYRKWVFENLPRAADSFEKRKPHGPEMRQNPQDARPGEPPKERKEFSKEKPKPHHAEPNKPHRQAPPPQQNP